MSMAQNCSLGHTPSRWAALKSCAGPACERLGLASSLLGEAVPEPVPGLQHALQGWLAAMWLLLRQAWGRAGGCGTGPDRVHGRLGLITTVLVHYAVWDLTEYVGNGSTCIMSPACWAPASATAPATRLATTLPGATTAKITCKHAVWNLVISDLARQPARAGCWGSQVLANLARTWSISPTTYCCTICHM